MVLKTYMKLCMAEPDVLEKKFINQNWEMGQQKQGLLNL